MRPGLVNTAEGWGWPARLLHWGMAALTLFQLGLGVGMVWLVDDIGRRFAFYQTHKSWGFVIFVLALVRIGWRVAQPAPEPPPGLRRIDVLAARAGHLALYVLMLALPVTGWLMASASPLQDRYGLPTMVFGWFALPDPFRPGDAGLEATLKAVHAGTAILLAVLLAGHVAAALQHHFGRRNRVLMRMIAGR